MFLHPVEKPLEANLFEVSSQDMSSRFEDLTRQFDAHQIQRGMVSFFDNRVLASKKFFDQSKVAQASGRFAFSYLPDIDDVHGEKSIEKAKEQGFCSITFHPYLQRIDCDRYQDVCRLAQYAEAQGMFVCICSAYGSKDIYNFFSLPLAVHLAETVSCPIVLAHAGGAKILDAMLIAEAFPHLYLETSFSLPYWLGSSVETDFAFAMKKIGVHRWMFGSDAPFWDLGDALRRHLQFFDRHRFSSQDIEQIMGGTAAQILGGYFEAKSTQA